VVDEENKENTGVSETTTEYIHNKKQKLKVKSQTKANRKKQPF